MYFVFDEVSRCNSLNSKIVQQKSIIKIAYLQKFDKRHVSHISNKLFYKIKNLERDLIFLQIFEVQRKKIKNFAKNSKLHLFF